MSRILAIDPGDARIGLAVSDPTRTLARPLTVIEHVSRSEDVRTILALADEYEVSEIVVGVPYGLESPVGRQAEKSLRLVETLKSVCPYPIHTWDESGSTLAAENLGSRHELDAVAAAVILQEYLDAKIR